MPLSIEKGTQTKMGKTVFFTKKGMVAVNMLISCTGGPSPRGGVLPVLNFERDRFHQKALKPFRIQ
jgi:hypothetical protein